MQGRQHCATWTLAMRAIGIASIMHPKCCQRHLNIGRESSNVEGTAGCPNINPITGIRPTLGITVLTRLLLRTY
jgi:hypothetical protein